MSMFTQPTAPGGGITWANHLGALILIEVTGQEHGFVTAHGSSDPVKAHIVVIDGPGAGDRYDDALIFPLVLISQTRNNVGQKVLGRLGQTNPTAGKNPAWILNEATSADIAKAEAWVLVNAKPKVTSARAPF